ncbi:MAG: 2-oxoacid:acceptor oxidoreductase family protein, partial [Sulfolobales archaeon]
MVKTVNIAIASVGGQGGLTLSRVLAVAAVLDGLSVRTGETLGMAQRYGSVVSYVRIGTRVLSPTFSDGEGDYLLGLELLET